jgi:NAD(P)-dependent dehydrogenase (short-subunit alcohol dehydrogenase family)
MPVAIVTGGSAGLGLAICRSLVVRGWSVVLDGRRTEPLRAAERELGWLGDVVVALPGDVADAAHREALVAAAWGAGGLDLLVNNASELGPSPQPGLAEYPLDELRRVYEVDVLAPLALVQAALPVLASSSGTVVDVSSDAAVEAYEGWGGYGSAKAALDHLTAVLAVEHEQVRWYAFDPGDMRTALHQRAFPGEDISDRPDPATVVPALWRLLEERPPSGRYRAAELTTAVPA